MSADLGGAVFLWRLEKVIKNRYTYTIKWSAEDEVYVCRIERFSSLGTHGNTPEEALKEMNIVLDYIEKGMKKEFPV